MSKRKRKRKRGKFIFVLIFLIVVIMAIYFFINYKTFLGKINYDINGNITYYDRYGIHLNFKGDFKLDDSYDSPILVLSNGNFEKVIDWELDKDKDKYSFETSRFINKGINLETLDNGNYYLLIKAKKNDDVIYFPLINKTKYEDIIYYTLSKNGKNKKIDITWDKFEGHEVLGFHIKNTNLPDDVYDITIDPGHDGNDSGMIVCENGDVPNSNGKCLKSTTYKEADINFDVASALKEKLEKMGYKVKLTRDSKEDTVPTYGEMGSGTMANTTKSKFNLALHHNSTNIPEGMSTTYGFEVYVAGNSSFDLARSFVKNIGKYADVLVSTKEEFKVEDGIYQRFSSDGVPYYYMIREIGGIATGAYQDGSNTMYDENPYYDSNDTAEGYLFELGYIDNVAELKNILNNPSGYAKGIALGLDEYLSGEING